jgi:Putative adhesin
MGGKAFERYYCHIIGTRMYTRIQIAGAAIAIVLALALLLTGRSSKKESERPADEVIEQTYKVSADASLRITNPRGSVAIRGADTSEVRMHAVKSASSAAQLKNITVDVTAEPGDVLIKTAFLRQKNMPFYAGTTAVDYTLSVPRSARIPRLDLDDGKASVEGIQNADVRANVVNGQLEIRNCCGNLKVAVANGGLDIVYGRCEGPYFSAEAQILNGNARLSIARGAALRVHAETVNGKITNSLDTTVELNEQSSGKIDLSLGTGRRSDLTVRVTSGDITIVAAEPGG